MKAVIPVAGVGSRLRPHTHTNPTTLINVAGKPILGHIVDALIDAGVESFVFVIGYMGEKVKNYVNETYTDLEKDFVVQNSRQGIAHAILASRDLIKEEDEILISLGDTIIELNLPELLASPSSVIGTKKVEDPRNFGVVVALDDRRITRVVEKPGIPKSNQGIVGIYKIKEVQQLLEAIEYNVENNIRTRGEFHLTDALMRMIEQGTVMKVFPIENWFDCGKKDNLIETNQVLLRRPGNSSVKSKCKNSIIIEPVSIAADCEIKNSIIGPYVSIGEKAVMNNAIFNNSIIGPYARIENVLLKNSILGADSALKGVFQSLNIGDSTEINSE